VARRGEKRIPNHAIHHKLKPQDEKEAPIIMRPIKSIRKTSLVLIPIKIAIVRVQGIKSYRWTSVIVSEAEGIGSMQTVPETISRGLSLLKSPQPQQVTRRACQS